MDNIKQVIKLYLSEYSGGNLYNRSIEYRKATDALEQKMSEIGGDNTELQHAIDELIALTEGLSFEDGFQAGIKHIMGLVELASK